MSLKFESSMRSAASIIYNRLPPSDLKERLRKRFSKLTCRYALTEMVRKAELHQDGIFCVELNDGTIFYGKQDNIPLAKNIALKTDKFKDIEPCNEVLGLIHYQYIKREYEKHYHLKQGDIVVDAGANIGTFTIKAAKIVGDKGRVIAIEPGTSNLKLLQRNIEANNLNNVTVVPKGVWSKNGVLKFNLSSNSTGHSFYKDEFYGNKDSSDYAEVEVTSIDNILRELNINLVDFIKMDIEGAEIEALNGMTEVLRQHVKLVIEALHIVNGQETYKVVIPELQAKGFKVRKEGELVFAHKN